LGVVKLETGLQGTLSACSHDRSSGLLCPHSKVISTSRKFERVKDAWNNQRTRPLREEAARELFLRKAISKKGKTERVKEKKGKKGKTRGTHQELGHLWRGNRESEGFD
jgi:hypothetical protein